MLLSFKFDFKLYRIQNKKRNKINCIILKIRKENTSQVLKWNKEICHIGFYLVDSKWSKKCGLWIPDNLWTIYHSMMSLGACAKCKSCHWATHLLQLTLFFIAWFYWWRQEYVGLCSGTKSYTDSLSDTDLKGKRPQKSEFGSLIDSCTDNLSCSW